MGATVSAEEVSADAVTSVDVASVVAALTERRPAVDEARDGAMKRDRDGRRDSAAVGRREADGATEGRREVRPRAHG
jgi:hypothetical protein